MKRDFWVQGKLFDNDAQELLQEPHSARGRSEVRRPRLDRSRVTRDPAVALSHTAQARCTAEIRLGLANAFGQLSAADRDAIRQTLNRRPRRAA